MVEYPIVHITWEDSATADGWSDVPCTPMIIETVGYLMCETEDYIEVASSRDAQGQARHRTGIIKKNIISRQALSLEAELGCGG